MFEARTGAAAHPGQIRRPGSSLAWLCALLVVLLLVVAGRPAPASAAGTTFQGVHLHSLWWESTSEVMDRELDLAQAAGSNVVRVDVGWDSLQTGGKDRYSQWYLDKLDRFVAGADARGMKVIATLTSTPCWASSAPDTLKQDCSGQWWDRKVQLYPPTRASDYADVARFITDRYGTKLAALEIWNEPNLDVDRFFIAPDEPAAYAEILKAAYPAAKAGNPEVDVLAGSLAYMNGEFLERLYALGIRGYYDGLSVHPYNDRLTPTTREWSGVEWIRGMQRAAGDDKPLWLTEFGWSTCRIGSGWCKSETEQAANTRAGFLAAAADPGIKAVVAYNLRDKGTNGDDMEDNFGLVKRDFTPKPGYSAMRAALTAPGEAPPPLPTDPAPPVGAPAPPTIPAPPPTGPVAAPRAVPVADGQRARTAAQSPRSPAQPLKLYVTKAAENRRTLRVSGRIEGRASGTIGLTASYSNRGGPFRRVTQRQAPVRNGRFQARVARFRHGRWKVRVVLKGAPRAVDAQQFRLDEGGGGRLPESGAGGEISPGAEQGGDVNAPSEQVVGQVALGPPTVSPGPLPGGGYLEQGSGAGADSVRELQRMLGAAGFRTSVDGVFGPDTEASVRRFQEANDLLVDGVVGRQTMSTLEEGNGA